MMKQSLAFSFIGESFRYQASVQNGFGKTGKVIQFLFESINPNIVIIFKLFCAKGYHNPIYIAFMLKHYPLGFTYPEFGPMFTAEFFDPVQWANILKSSGAK